MYKRLIAGLLIFVMALARSGSHAALAQDGELSEEQVALLDRIFAAREQLEVLESYVEEVTGIESQALTIVLGEQSLELLETTEWVQTQTVINAPEGKNVDAQISAAVSSQGEHAFRVLAEARRVDGTLYVSAAYDEPSADLQPLPEGWIALDEEDADAIGDQYPALAALQLDSLVSDEPPTLLEDQQRMRESASDVFLELVTLEDGTEAEQITIVFERDALLDVVLEGSADPFQVGLFSALTDDSMAILTVVLDADDRALSVLSVIQMSAIDIDAAALSPEDFPPGSLLSFTFEGSEEQVFSEIDSPFEPVTAPDELVPVD